MFYVEKVLVGGSCGDYMQDFKFWDLLVIKETLSDFFKNIFCYNYVHRFGYTRFYPLLAGSSHDAQTNACHGC